MGRYTCSDCAYMDTNVKSNGKYRCTNCRSGYDEVAATMAACNVFCDCLYSRRSSSERAALYRASRDKGLWILTAIMDILDLEQKDLYLGEFAYLKTVMLPLIEGGNEWIRDYDTFGPIIADRLHKEENAREVAESLFNEFILPFHNYFVEGNIDDAFTIYQNMYRSLKLKYGIEPMPKRLGVIQQQNQARA